METKDKVESADVNKTPKIIKAVAKEEIGKLDVLVCGECHDVFYFIEEFKAHKENKCDGASVTRDNCKNETNPQVWGFMLWKHAQIKKDIDEENPPTPWSIYQQWCKLNPKEKEGWVVAGESIQCFSKISSAKVQEIKANAQVVKNKQEKPNVQVKNNSSDELLEEGEIQPHDSENDAEDESEEKVKNNNVNKKPVLKPKPSTNSLKDIKPISNPLRKALRTGKNENIEEAIVEKILGRRLNHKKKCTEYFIKWENMSESENTWEPKIHLIKCKALMDEFDSIIDKKKNLAKGNTKSVESQLEEMESDHSRPQRTSKQKALSQVKVWCGDISEGDEASGKRKSFSDDDSTDSFEKKIKMEDDSDTTDDDRPSVTIRRVPKTQGSVNGVTKKNSDVTIPTTQRVVRVNQKQLPNLSSGVYIMSKTEGIIKLDSNSSATGGPLLKVGSKIGQTHIKMVKKEDTVTPKGIASRLQPGDKKSPIISKGRGMSRKLLSNPTAIKTVMKINDTDTSDKLMDSKSSPFDDDSDGLEELEFPTDLPLPEPDSPPGEFTLCPLTGRVLRDTEEPKEPEDVSADSTSLDTLVKLAAAELPDVDLDPNTEKKEANATKEITPIVQTETSKVPTLVVEPKVLEATSTSAPATTVSTSSIATTVTDLEASIKPSAIEKSTSTVLNIDDVLTPAQPKTTESSLLNTTLTNVHVLPSPNKPIPPKKLLSTPSTVRQKVTTFQRHTINRPVMPKPSPTSTIIHKVSPSRSKLGASRSFQEPLVPILKRTANISTYKSANVAKRIGNTTIYKTEKPASTPIVKKGLPTSFNAPQTISTPPSSKATSLSSTVINMPLLTVDDEPAPIAESTNTTQQLAEIQPLPVLSTDSEMTDLSTFNLADSETPLLITGDDGTIYQVAGQNEDGQTILISEGPDGQQQCVIVSSECSNDEISVMMGDAAAEPEQMEVEQPLTINTQADPEGDSTESEESQVVAQIIKADPPSPGGTRKVVLMLPDGNLMMTNVTAEQYAALELDK
ncbi:hypothetical protein RN001_011867 [Aquatica leii]|uniref:Chromo domain-containing protein n=1 Tax=Aquatica leii TaxID=1421715 RepID=A0AAN7SP96_9COLE|nr:hypothetical protein RN001_011867 [Aquatica leii]